jgi:hypothetical protein
MHMHKLKMVRLVFVPFVKAMAAAGACTPGGGLVSAAKTCT